MKILAIDYGKKRVGLAVGDVATKFALPFGTLENLETGALITKIKEIIDAEDIKKIIVGEPITLSGNISVQTIACREFTEELSHQAKLPVELVDERLTSAQVDSVVQGVGAPTRGRDELAAMFLLQDYLERQAFNN